MGRIVLHLVLWLGWWLATLASCFGQIASGPRGVAPPAMPQRGSKINLIPQGMKITELAQRAAAAHPAVLAARERVAEAEGLRRQAAFRPNPALEIDVSTARAFGSPGEGERSIGISQAFELGGKRRSRVEVSDAGVEIAQALAAEAERRSRDEINVASIETIFAHREFSVLEQQLVTLREFLHLTRARAREGEIAPLEADLVQVEVARQEAQQALAGARLERNLAVLEQLLPPELLPLNLQDDVATEEVLVSESDLRDRALTDRPDLDAARLRTQQAHAQVRLASALAKPDLVGSIRYSQDVQALDDLPVPGRVYTDRDNQLAFGVSIPLPFWNRNQGNIQAAASAERASRHDVAALRAVIAREVTASYAVLRAASKARAILRRDGLEPARKNVGVIREAYRLGQLRLLDVLNEQRRTFDLELTLSQTERELALAAAALETAVGRGLGLLP